MSKEKIVICGAGGYVGSQMIAYLLNKGHTNILAISAKPAEKWLRPFYNDAVKNHSADLKCPNVCIDAVYGATQVYNFAAKVGGIGFIGGNQVDCMLSSLINTNLLRAAENWHGLSSYFFASSSCVYPPERGNFPFKESDAYPANPMQGYGWEKLFSERMCEAYRAERNVPTVIARLHGVYGPGDFRDAGKDHVIQALCQKVVEAKLSGKKEICIWGDGHQTRSFLFIEDAIEGIYKLANAGVPGPVNLANSQVVSVNELVTMLEEIAGVTLEKFYSVTAPTGRSHKSSDNTLLRETLSWEPMISIRDGLRKTYNAVWDRAMQAKI